MKTGKYRAIAEQIRERLANDPSWELPSIATLATRHGVGTATVWRAVRFLAGKGLVACEAGSRTRRIDLPGSDRVSANAGRAFYLTVRKQLQEGVYNRGELLPKFTILAAGHRVSQLTITRAFRRLSDEQLIHKQGKRWIAGPRPVDIPATAAPHPGETGPTMLLVCTDTQQSLFHNSFLQVFLGSMEMQLREEGIRCCLAFRKKETEHSPVPNQGTRQVQQTLRALGDFYRGAVIVDQFSDAATMAEWGGFLSRQGARPVVFFDASDTRRHFTRSELELRDRYYRMHFDERAAVKLAADHLTDSGHRRIGMPTIRGDWPWVRQRTRRIREAVRKHVSRPELLSATLREPFWETVGLIETIFTPGTLPERIRCYVESCEPRDNKRRVRSALSRKSVLRHTPSMVSLISRDVTAIIALNDWLAHQLYTWCYTAGVRIPEDLSIISFDNDPITRMFPFSTIDLGFAQLGHLAARIIGGAAPSQADREGNTPGVCTVVDHGSVARPGRMK